MLSHTCFYTDEHTRFYTCCTQMSIHAFTQTRTHAVTHMLLHRRAHNPPAAWRSQAEYVPAIDCKIGERKMLFKLGYDHVEIKVPYMARDRRIALYEVS